MSLNRVSRWQSWFLAEFNNTHCVHICTVCLRAGSTEGVCFYLSVSNSIERAVAEMEQGRGVASVAQTTIDRATGTESQEEALENAEELGEEAYFMEVNGTLNIRVGNVQIQVLPMEDQEQMRKVGRIVSMGLSKS